MTNQALIQAKVWNGYAQAAKRLGVSYQFYRPAGSYPGAAVISLPVSLNAEDMKYSKPQKYGKATWYALVDGTSLQAGDYFIGPQGTFFVAGLQPLLPILVVECNRTVSLSRVAALSGINAPSYGGMQNEVAYATGVPCSILQGTKGEKGDVGLPADTRMPWWNILMPASVGAVIFGDLIIDDMERRYIVSSSELTSLGYRLTAMLAMT
jgi:hypothetical protein